MLCDQLFLNAAARREQLCVRELGPAFNYVGSELRRPAGKRTVLPPAAAACLACASPAPRPAPRPTPRSTPRSTPRLGTHLLTPATRVRRALIKPPSSARRGALRDACVAHLTRKVPKLYTADWLVHRSLAGDDALQCARNGSEPQDRHWRRAMLGRMPDLGHKYSFEEELCRGQSGACALQPWVAAGNLTSHAVT